MSMYENMCGRVSEFILLKWACAIENRLFLTSLKYECEVLCE